MKRGCILMAAGAATRFGGGNKLLADFLGQPVYTHALSAIPHECFEGVAVVSGEPVILDAAKARGFLPVLNDPPFEGASRTVALGIRALPDADALLFMVADQPCLRMDTVRALLAFANEHPDSIVRLRCGDQIGNPVLFPRAYFDALLSLKGDEGGGRVCREHPEALSYFDIENASELSDVDSRDALLSLAASQAKPSLK